MKSFKTFSLLAVVLCVDSLVAQNIVVPNLTGFTANPVALTDMEVSELTGMVPRIVPATQTSPATQRIARKLSEHVRQFLEGAPWMPFQQTLGISGQETAFAHPDEVFYTLSLALPLLPEPLAGRVRNFLQAELREHPPYAETGYAFAQGRAREPYAVPARLRRSGLGRAPDRLGIYAFWLYVRHTGDSNAAAPHWPAIRQRMEPLLQDDYRFNPRPKRGELTGADALNGNLAGLIGYIRLAQALRARADELPARTRCKQLLEFRLNLDRLNPTLLEPSRHATRALHNARLTRLCRLVPDLAEIIAQKTEGCAAGNLTRFREERNGWHLAYGDRMIGGENFTNPVHFPWSVFLGATLIEKRPAVDVLAWVDVPWCRGDLYFIQICTLALWSATGQSWVTL